MMMTWGTNLKPCNTFPTFRLKKITSLIICIYFYVIGVVLKAFGVNNICLYSFKQFVVYVDRE